MAAKKSAKSKQDDFVDPVIAASESISAAGIRAAASTSEVSRKMIDHAEANTREAFAAMRAVTNATSMAEVLQIQGDYIRAQGGRAMTQAREIGEIIAQFGQESIKAAKPAKDAD